MNTFVSDPDREARANSVKNAVAICRMEGGEPSEYCLEQLALFEAGHISATEYARPGGPSRAGRMQGLTISRRIVV
jgi:hypothetical protein